MSDNEWPWPIKICVIGTPDQLKNQFIRRYAVGKFETNYLPTQGVDIMTREIDIDGNKINLIIVDTASQEFFDKIRPSYYRGASAAIITFDKADKSSFLHVEDWLSEFRKCIFASASINLIPIVHTWKREQDLRIPIALVGFITDTEEVSTEMSQQLATQLKLDYYETPVTNGQVAERIFKNLCKDVLYRGSREEGNYLT